MSDWHRSLSVVRFDGTGRRCRAAAFGSPPGPCHESGQGRLGRTLTLRR
jgi:hypothetical protein